MGGLAFGMLASNPFFRGMGGFGFSCGCGYGGVGGFIFGGMYNAVNLTGFANPFPSIFGGGYMGGGYASSAGLIMPTTFANAQFPTIDFRAPFQTIWDTYTNPNSDYNKQMIDWFQKMNSQYNPFVSIIKKEDKTDKNKIKKETITPPKTSLNKNKSRTTQVKVESKNTTFDKMLEFVFAHEGGYVNHPADRGGATNMGITQKTYNSYRKKNRLATQSVKYITKEEATEIYKNIFDLCGASKITNPQLAMCVFDWANHSGAGNPAIKKALKECDGDVDKFIKAREDFLNRLIANDPSQDVFRKGWNNRINDLSSFVQNNLSESYA